MTLLGTAMAILSMAGCASPKSAAVQVRPLTIRVVDAATKKPLANVPVAYAVHAMVSRPGAAAAVDANVGQRLAHRARARTDGRGEATFKPGTVQLGPDERLDDEVVLVNLDVDMAHPDARTWLEALQSRCKASPRTCSGPPDEIEVALEMSQIESGSAAYRNPLATRAGKLVVVKPGGPRPGFDDWAEPGAAFAVQFQLSNRNGPEAVTVELGPAPSRGTDHGRK